MQVTPVDFISYEVNSPYEVSTTDNLLINEPSADNSDNALAVNGIEPTATSVAISAITPESIQLQELQDNIVSVFNDLKDGNISKDEFSNRLEELGLETNNISNNEKPEKENFSELTSALIESVKGNSQGGSEIELSSYASIMDIVNKETQSPSVNEQLQAYTQNLRN